MYKSFTKLLQTLTKTEYQQSWYRKIDLIQTVTDITEKQKRYKLLLCLGNYRNAFDYAYTSEVIKSLENVGYRRDH